MRYLILALALAAPSVAVADTPLPPIDPASIPPECKAVASVPADVAAAGPGIGARISLANCAAMVKMSALHLTPDDASFTALGEAAAPSLALYQAAIDAGDANLAGVAKAARADLYLGMVVRMRNAVPAITLQTVGAALADHDRGHAFVEGKIGPWLQKSNER
jgi:hypothetical protein